MDDPVVQKAIRNVVGRHAPDEWCALPPRQQAQVIYEEIKRLDLKAAQQTNSARTGKPRSRVIEAA